MDDIHEINETYLDFVLSYCVINGGLYSLVIHLEVTEDNTFVDATVHPTLIQTFYTTFPNIPMEELDIVVKWILITSFARIKETTEWQNNTH